MGEVEVSAANELIDAFRPEDLHGSHVGVNNLFVRLDVDGVGHTVDQPPVMLLQFAQRRLGALSLSQVSVDRKDRTATLPIDRNREALDRYTLAIEPHALFPGHLGREPLLDHLEAALLHRIQEIGMDE